MDNFLTTKEKKEIKTRCYEEWLSSADALTLLPLLSGKGFLNDRQEQEIKLPTRTQYEQNDYFFCNILLRLTRDKYIQLIHILKDDDKHKAFAHEFAKILEVSLTKRTGPTSSDPPEEIVEHTMETDGEVTSAGFNFKNPKRPSVDSYGTKKMSRSGRGNGIVFIIANFTDELQGYKTDIICITEFFKEKLGYDVFTEIGGIRLENVTKDKLLEALPKMQGLVDLNGNYDRFYMFVLSHGDENGVLGCDWQSIPVKDIVRPFQHDQMKSMKDFPKLFFIQACRGTNFTEVAGHHSQLKAQQLIPIEADQMLCYAVTESNFAFVFHKKGSLFVKEVMKAFIKYYDSSEDIGVIMREAKYNIAHSEELFLADGKQRKYTMYNCKCI